MMISLSSFGSLGVRRMNNSSSNSARRASVSATSALASSASSSPPVASCFASVSCCSSRCRASPLAMSSSSSVKRLFLAVKSAALYASGRAKKSASCARSACRLSRSRKILAIATNYSTDRSKPGSAHAGLYKELSCGRLLTEVDREDMIRLILNVNKQNLPLIQIKYNV